MSEAPVNQHSNARPFLLALAVAWCICSLSYVLSHLAPVELREFVAWPLLPGVALYSVANGSFLFGSGFGNMGNFLLIVTGAALAWASLFAVFRQGARRWSKK